MAVVKKRTKKAAHGKRRLRPLLEEAGQTLNGLSRASGIGRGMLNAYDRGRTLPTWPTVRRIAAHLGLGVIYVADTLFGEEAVSGN